MDSYCFNCAVALILLFFSFPIALLCIVKTADYRISPLVQHRYRIAAAIAVLCLLTAVLYYTKHFTQFKLLYIPAFFTSVSVFVLVVTEIVLLHIWKREFREFGKACPTNATSYYCDMLYNKMECQNTQTFLVNVTEIVNGEATNRTVEEYRRTLDTCYIRAKKSMKYVWILIWAYLYAFACLYICIFMLASACVAIEKYQGPRRPISDQPGSTVNESIGVEEADVDPGDL